MMRSFFWMGSLGALLTVGCGEQQEQPADLSDCRADEGDGLEFEEGGYIEGDKLFLTVGYGGGCEEHVFTLCWPSQTFMESAPVQVGLEVLHNANNDMCDAYFFDPIEFDLTPLREAYVDSYGGGGTILVNVGGESLEYTFE